MDSRSAHPHPRLPRLLSLLVLLVAAPGLLSAGSARAAAPEPPRPTTVAALAQPPGVPADANATFGIRPATGGKPDSRTLLSYGATPGARLRDAVVVRNVGSTDLTLKVYATDAVNDSTGQIAFREEGDRATDVGSWVTLDGGPQQISVTAGQDLVVPFTLAIPAGAAPGDHFGAVFVQLDAEGVGTDGAKVTLKQRVATRIALRVGGPLRPQLTISGFSSRYEQSPNPFGAGRVLASWTLTNTGNVALRGDQRLLVSGLWTHVTAPAEPVAALLPGNSVVVTARADGVHPAGRLTVRAVVGPSAAPGTDLPPQANVVASTHAWAVPWALLALVLLLVAALLLVRRGRKGRYPAHHASRGRTPAPAGAA